MILRIVEWSVEVAHRGKLGILADRDLPHEDIGMADEAAYQSTEDIGVGSTALGPLVVDLHDHYVVDRDQPVRVGRGESVLV